MSCHGQAHNIMIKLTFSWIGRISCSSGGAMVLGKLPVLGRPTIWMIVGQGPIAFAVGAGGGCLDIVTLLCLFSPLSPALWEMASYRLKHCLKGPLNPTNQPFWLLYHLMNDKVFKVKRIRIMKRRKPYKKNVDQAPLFYCTARQC